MNFSYNVFVVLSNYYVFKKNKKTKVELHLFFVIEYLGIKTFT